MGDDIYCRKNIKDNKIFNILAMIASILYKTNKKNDR